MRFVRLRALAGTACICRGTFAHSTAHLLGCLWLALFAMCLGGVPLALRADVYSYLGGSFDDPNSWSDTTTGTHGVPGPGDTAHFSDGIVATPGGQTFGMVLSDGSLTFTGG